MVFPSTTVLKFFLELLKTLLDAPGLMLTDLVKLDVWVLPRAFFLYDGVRVRSASGTSKMSLSNFCSLGNVPAILLLSFGLF